MVLAKFVKFTVWEIQLNCKKINPFILPDLNAIGAERIVTTIANHLPRDKKFSGILLLRKEGLYLILKDDVEIIDIKTLKNSKFSKTDFTTNQKKNQTSFQWFWEVNAYLSLFIKLFPKIKFIARETNVVSQHIYQKRNQIFYKF